MKAAIIGFGNMGRKHASIYTANQIHVAMVANTAAESERVLEQRESYDIVSVCSPDDTHAHYAGLAMARGKPALCEKPLATSLAGLDTLQSYVKMGGRLHCHLPLRHVRELKESPISELGAIYGASLAYNYGRLYKLQAGWRGEDDYSILMGGGVHMVDALMWLLGGDVADIKSIRNPLYAKAIFRLSRTLCDLTCNFAYDGAHQHCLALYGEKNSLAWVNETEVPKEPGIQEFIDCVKHDRPMNFDSAYRSHKACLEMA